MQGLIICFLLITNFFFFSKPIDAQEFQFTIPHNSIHFKRHENYQIKERTKTNLKPNDGFSDAVMDGSPNLFYLSNGNQQYLLKEHFDPSLIIEINDFYSIDLFKDFPPALTFDYLVESEEDLLVLDEPIFYITLEGENEQELIFAQINKQSESSWQKVVLDLRRYDLVNKKLFFHVGNLGAQEWSNSIYIKNLSSQIIVWHNGDQLFFNDQLIKNHNDFLVQGLIKIANEDWPIYQLTKQKISNLIAHQEVDGSLTLLFSPLNEVIFKNHQWFLSCGDSNSQELVQKNYYLLPQLHIKDFWPNLGDRVVLNTLDFYCDDVKRLSMEVY